MPIRLLDIQIKKIDDEWCAFLFDREIARSPDKSLLIAYLKDSVVTSR